jgi:endonuclease/exonuclease/phosphatase family metal-dependent hydrolase
MGNKQNILEKNFENKLQKIKLMTYNVEWGFLNLPPHITEDANGNKIPQTQLAQTSHLNLISKNIGLLEPDICFLQEIGSEEVMKYISSFLNLKFGIDYSYYYSNNNEVGIQGIGLLIKKTIPFQNFTVEKIPNFYLNKALGIKFQYNNKIYKVIGAHLKSLYDHKYNIDVKEQVSQVNAILNWVNNTEYSVICGDFNNIPTSLPIKKMLDSDYIDLINTKKYIKNITGNTNTEFFKKDSKNKQCSSRIDYIFTTKNISCNCINIVNYQRITSTKNKNLRSENSDHLPIFAILYI